MTGYARMWFRPARDDSTMGSNIKGPPIPTAYVRKARDSGKSIKRWKNATTGQIACSNGLVYGRKYGDTEAGMH
jgi:hypothetical protein